MTYHHDANQNTNKVEFLKWFQFNKIVPSLFCVHFTFPTNTLFLDFI
jgi:hypothetical protein